MMNTQRPSISSARMLAVFLILFVAYQAPQGIGQLLLQSFPVMSALMLMFFPIALGAARVLGFRGYDAWFLGRSGKEFLGLFLLFVCAVSLKFLAIWIGSKFGVYQVSSIQTEIQWTAIASALAMTFFPSIAEDIVTRGFVMRCFSDRLNTWGLIFLSSLVYVLNHIYRLQNGPMEWFMLFCFGLAYAAAMVYRQTLWAAVGLHWGWNFAGTFSDQVIDMTLLNRDLQSIISSASHLVVFFVLGLLILRYKQRLQTS